MAKSLFPEDMMSKSGGAMTLETIHDHTSRAS